MACGDKNCAVCNGICCTTCKDIKYTTATKELKSKLEQFETLEKVIRKVRLAHTSSCNSYMGWGDNDQCDCPAKDVRTVLKALNKSKKEGYNAPRC